MSNTTTFTCDPAALYLMHDGAVCCGDHLGVTPSMTGRDMYGHPVAEITREATLELPELLDLGCDTCGRKYRDAEGMEASK